jgi:O-antigen/teichoic acid export membrane protein
MAVTDASTPHPTIRSTGAPERDASAISAGALARSSAYVNAAQVWQLASRLVMTPVVLSHLGLEGYGAWALVNTLCASAIALDTAAGWTYAKLTAELDGRKDFALLSEVVSSGLLLAGGIAALALTAVWVTHAWLIPLLGVPPSLFRQTELALVILSLAVELKALGGCVLAVLAGCQRMDLQYRFIIAGSVVEFAIALPLLFAGVGMAALALGVLGGTAVSIAAASRACRRLRPAIHVSPSRVSVAGIRSLLRVGVRFQSLVLIGSSARQATRLLISSLYGAAALGTFSLADRMLVVAGAPGLAIISPLMPAFATLGSERDFTRLQQLVVRASKALAIAAAPPLLFASVCAGPILFGWTGQRLPETEWAVRVLAPAEFFALVAGVAAARLRARGMVRPELTSEIIGTALALAGLVIAYPLVGFAGSVAAVALGRSAAALVFLRRFVSIEKLHGWPHFRATIIRPVLPLAGVAIALAIATWELPGLRTATGGRAGVLGMIALLGIAYALASASVAWLVALSAGERARVLQLVRRRPRVAGDCAMDYTGAPPQHRTRSDG